MTNKKYSGWDDKNGIPINHGDIVRFYFDANNGYSDSESEGYSEMIDLCAYDEEDGAFYLNCDLGMGSFVWRCNQYCEVIGNVYENIGILLESKYDDWSLEYIKHLIPELNKKN